MPNQANKDYSADLNALIKSGERISVLADPHAQSSTSEIEALNAYQKWCGGIRTFFQENNIYHYLPEDFFIGEKIEPQRRPLLERQHVFRTTEEEDELKKFRHEISTAAKIQVDTLKKIIDDLSRNAKPLIIHIEKDGTIWREPKNKYLCSAKGHTGRTKFILILAQASGFVQTETLLSKFKKKKTQQLSQEKRRINMRLARELKLSQDLIIGKRLVGYRINTAFRVVLPEELD